MTRPRSAPPTGRTRKKKKEARTWEFWMGFSDGKPHYFEVEEHAGEAWNALSVQRNRRLLNRSYDDVRRVRITELPPTRPTGAPK